MTTALMTGGHIYSDWIDTGAHAEVTSPYDGETFARVSVVDPSHIDEAVRSGRA